MDDMLRVGVVVSTHGIKGEVKVFPTTDDVKRFNHLKKVYLIKESNFTSRQKNITELEVKSVRYFKQYAIVKFVGIDDINDVEKYKGLDMYVTREDAVTLEDGEYFITDLIGIEVYEGEQYIGVLNDVLQTGANDIYVIKLDESVPSKSRELLLPAIKECILDINLENKRMQIKILEGLLEL